MPSAAAVGPVRAPGISRARWGAGHPRERSAASWREPGDARIEERRPWKRRRCSDWAVGSGGHPSAQRELGKAAPARAIVQSATSAASAQLEARGDCRRLGWIAPRIRASNRGQVPTSSPAKGASNANCLQFDLGSVLPERSAAESRAPRLRAYGPTLGVTGIPSSGATSARALEPCFAVNALTLRIRRRRCWLGPLHWFRSTSSRW
jgi:hypothetical protein